MRFCLGLLLVIFAHPALAAPPGSTSSTPVTFHADWFPGAQFAGVYVALEQGFYQKAGLEVTIEPFAYGKKSREQIDASPDTVGLGAIEGYIFLQERGRGRDIRALAAMLQESPAGFMSLSETGIEQVSDFAGKTIGVHRFGDPLYRWFLKRAGMEPDAAKMIFVNDDVSMLVRGEVAAMQGYATEEFLRLKAQVGERARFLSFARLGFDSYSEILFTTAAQWQRHPGEFRRFIDATRQGWSYALAHPAEAVAAIQRRLTSDSDAAALTATLEALRPYVTPANSEPLAPMHADKWQRMQAACVGMGFLPAAEPVKNFLNEASGAP